MADYRMRPWRRMQLVLAALLILTIAVPTRTAVEELMVPMRDGVKLATNVYYPEGEGPWPVVLSRTPYGKGNAAVARRARKAVHRTRLCAASSRIAAAASPARASIAQFIDDMHDGYDTVEWIADQQWSNGKVGMIGGSALGITANHAAMSGTPHLVCNVVIVAHGSSYHNSGYPGGVFLQEPERGMAPQAGRAAGRRAAADPPRVRRFVSQARHRTLLRQDERADGQHRRLVRHLQPGQHRLLRRLAVSRRRGGPRQPEADHGRLRPRPPGRRSEVSRPTPARQDRSCRSAGSTTGSRAQTTASSASRPCATT